MDLSPGLRLNLPRSGSLLSQNACSVSFEVGSISSFWSVKFDHPNPDPEPEPTCTSTTIGGLNVGLGVGRIVGKGVGASVGDSVEKQTQSSPLHSVLSSNCSFPHM